MTDTKNFIQTQVFSPVFDLEKQYANYKGILKGAVEEKVVTRFPPEPSGYLHIGHIKAALLNYHYAKMYKGKMILRFDDTNPSKQKMEFVDSIISDLEAMGIKHDRLTYTSDYFNQIIEYGRLIIKKGLAYCDNTPVEIMREQRGKKVEGKNRNLTIEQNLEIFQRMIRGQDDQYTLRAKIDMKSDNGCMRDPVLFRTQKLPHHRTGTKFTLYPTYDFACPIVDSVQGVTHVLRTNQYADRIPQYKWILKALDFPDLQIYQYSRLNLQYTVLSKRKLQWFVDTGRVSGWDDPRFPTFRGVIKKGIRVETLIEFMLQQGPSKNTNLMQWEKIWAINKRIIDPICPRYFAVSLQKISEILVTNGPKQPQAHSVILNPINQALGTRPIWRSSQVYIQYQDACEIQQNQKITLMKWGNVLIKTKEARPDGSFIFTAQYLPEDKDFKKTKKYSWLAKNANLVKATLVQYDHLMKTPKIQQDANFQQIVNVNSRFPRQCYVDPMIRTLQMDNFLQFQRRGFYKVAKITEANNDVEYEFIFTPDGKAKGLASITKETDLKGDIKKRNLEDKIKEKQKKTETKAQQPKQQRVRDTQQEKNAKRLERQKKKQQKAKKQQEAKQKLQKQKQLTKVQQAPSNK